MRAISPLSLLAALALIGCSEEPADAETSGGEDTVTSPADGETGETGEDGDTDAPDPVVDADGDGVSAELDCDDGDARVFPGAEEVCDGIDNDCDGAVDVGATDAQVFHADLDGDGYGDPAAATEACAQPADHVDNAEDCDDTDAATSPETAWYLDVDGDGYGDAGAMVQACAQPAGAVDNAEDCDDADAATSPETVHYADADGDGYGDPAATTVQCEAPEGTVRVEGDCDDTDAARNPDTIWYDDKDGDGYGSPTSFVTTCLQPMDTSANADDCDDADPARNPDTVWYADTDGDGYGDPSVASTSCEAPSAGTQVAGDCDDSAADSYPGAPERCDGVDHDCDGDGFDDDSIDADTWYRDGDGDGYGAAGGLTTTACSQPSGYAAEDTDCLDTNGRAYPDSHWTETPGDGIDQDCDGLDVCTDLDCDGYPDIVFANWRENNTTYATDSYVYHGSASGFSWVDRTGLAGTAAFAADVADYDQDGYLDIILAAFLPSDYTTDSSVLWGSASGHDAADSDALDTTGARAVCTGDFDADGYPDALFPAFATNGPSFSPDSVVHYGSSTGFVDSTALSTVGAFDCVVGDLDADGYEDAVIISNTADDTDAATRYATTSTIFWGGSGGLSDADTTDLTTYGARRVAIEDLDEDGWDDLVIAHHKVNSGVTSDDDEAYTVVFWSDGGTFDDADATELLTWGGYDTAVGDFDGDGYKDIAVAGWTGASGGTSGSTIFWGSSAGWSESDSTNIDTSFTVFVSAEDLDQDGYDDLVFSNYKETDTAADSYVYYGSASGFSTSDRAALPTLGSRRHTVADVNGDGWKDVVFANYFAPGTANRADSVVYYNSETGFDAADSDALPTFGARWTPIVVGD